MVMSLRERRALRLSMDDLNERREGFPIAIGNQEPVVYPSVLCDPEEIRPSCPTPGYTSSMLGKCRFMWAPLPMWGSGCAITQSLPG